MTRDDIKILKKYRSYPSITIIAPTHRTMPDRLKDPIKVKDLVNQATNMLLNEFDKRDVSGLINSLNELAGQIDFSKTLDGIAFFVNKNIAIAYDLPFKVEEKVCINRQFEIRELLRTLNRSKLYWILSISKKPARLFKATLGYIDEIIDSQEMQENMKGFPFQLNYDVTSDRELLAVGTGYKDSTYLTQFDKEFLRQLDNLLAPYLSNNGPLIILGTEKNRAYFQEVTKHKNLIVGQVEGDFSNSTIQEIQNVVEKIIKEDLNHETEKILKLFNEAIGDLKFSSGLKDTWHKAIEGRIDTLLIEDNYSVPGSINKDNNEFIVLYDHNVPLVETDIVDDLIDEVLARDGKVVFVKDGQLKDHDHVASILRY